MFTVTKRYPHSLGLSACFRQPTAESHCRFLHGYPLAFDITFGALTLDLNGWVADFGGLKWIKDLLVENFDHKTLIAEHDPHIATFYDLNTKGLIDLNVVPGVGCEEFARFVYDLIFDRLQQGDDYFDVILLSVKVSEHEGNSATYARDE